MYGVLLIAYVDDMKMSGPPDKMKKAWADLQSGPNGLIIGKVEPAGHFLGCTHEKGDEVAVWRCCSDHDMEYGRLFKSM